jgi:hypothetical protein
MKKIRIFLLVVILIIQPTVTSAAVYINQEYIDINHVNIDHCNYITLEDAVASLGYLPPEEIKIDEFIPIRAAAEQQGYFVRWDEENVYLDNSEPLIFRQTISSSYQNRPIEAVYLTPPSYTQTILATFAVHGFEDQYYRDGVILTQIAEQVIKYYSDQPELLKFTRLIIIPCVNPDGVNAGVSNNGFGRCNAQGIDINRDFDHNWGKINNSRNKTGNQPFASPEAQVLRDIVLKENPDIVLDFHGWLDCCYSSDLELKNCFSSSLDLGSEKKALPGYKPMQGYFVGWASQYVRAALIEYKYKDADRLTTQTIQAFNNLIQEI